LKIQWGAKTKGSNLSAGSGWESVSISSSDGFLNYSSSSSYKIFLTNKTSNAGTELVVNNQEANGFKFYLYNRNSSTTMSNPTVQWFTIGY
jgi:hypothetical protein